MRFFPRVVVYALAAFAAGYGVSRIWSSSDNPAIKGVKTAIRSAQLVASAASTEGGASERLVALCEKPSSLARDREIFETLQRMSAADFLQAAADFPALVSRFDKLPANLRGAVAEAAVERWVELDPEGLKQWLAGGQALMKNLPGRGEVELDLGILEAIVPHLARNDPAWCLARIKEMQDKQRESTLYVMFLEMAKVDAANAERVFANLGDEKFREVGLQGLLVGLAESDLKAAMDRTRELTGSARTRAQLGIVWAAGPRGASAQPDLISQIDDPRVRPLILYYSTHAIAERSMSDPVAYFEEQLALRGEEERPNLVQDVIRPLVNTYPERTAEFIIRLEGKTQASAIESMLQAWPDRDPGATMTWLSKLPIEALPVDSRNWDTTLAKLANRAPDEFQKWVDSLPSGKLQDTSRVLVATRLAQNGDLQQAIQTFQQAATGTMSETTASTFGRTIAERSPEKAAECVAQLPPGPVQASAAQGVASVWSERNPQEAASWVTSLPEGNARDSATNALASTLVYADPSASIEWLNQIRDPLIREKAALNVVSIWNWEDPAAARAWVKNFSFADPERKESLLRNMR